MATIKYKDGADWKYLPLGGPSSILMDAWHYVGGVDSLGTTFQNSWLNQGAPYGNLRFRKYLDGRVRIAGTIKSGTSGATIFILPVGYRPSATMYFPTIDNGGNSFVVVNPDGTVLTSALTGTVSLAHMDGIEFDTESVTIFPMAGVGLPSRVTTLPSSPSDGQEVYYVASAADGVLWHLKYNAGSASAYKWEFLGGPPTKRERADGGYRNASSWGELTTGVGEAITLPLAGDYDIEFGANVSGTGWVGVCRDKAGTTPSDPPASTADEPYLQASSGAAGTIARASRIKNQPAARLWRLVFFGSAYTCSPQWISMRPVRVG